MSDSVSKMSKVSESLIFDEHVHRYETQSPNRNEVFYLKAPLTSSGWVEVVTNQHGDYVCLECGRWFFKTIHKEKIFKHARGHAPYGMKKRTI